MKIRLILVPRVQSMDNRYWLELTIYEQYKELWSFVKPTVRIMMAVAITEIATRESKWVVTISYVRITCWLKSVNCVLSNRVSSQHVTRTHDMGTTHLDPLVAISVMATAIIITHFRPRKSLIDGSSSSNFCSEEIFFLLQQKVAQCPSWHWKVITAFVKPPAEMKQNGWRWNYEENFLGQSDRVP